eukprot:jgi/Orpsp1_1/1177626/evm.model.c7180000062196.1
MKNKVQSFNNNLGYSNKDINNSRYEGLTISKNISSELTLNNGNNIGFIVPGNNTNIINIIMNNHIFENLSLNSIIFENEEEMENYYKSNSNSLVAGVIFDQDLFSYTLRVDGSSIPDPSVNSDIDSISKTDNYLNIFTPLQLAIDQAIIQMKTGDNSIDITANIGKLPLIKVVENKGLKFWDIYSIELIILIFILPMIKPIQFIVSEKENKIKSFLMTIGMHPSSLWLSWLIFNSTFTLLMSIYTCVIFALLKLFQPLVALMVFIIIFLFSISLNSLILLLSTFFRKSKTAFSVTDILSLVYIILYVPFYFCPEIVKFVASLLLSSVSSGVAMEKILLFKYSSKPQNEVFFQKDILIYVGVLLWNSILYFGLALISDYLLSEENQSFLSIRKSKNTDHLDTSCSNYISPFKKDIEQYHGNEDSYVEVSNIIKEFEDNHNKKFLAVNRVSFKAYKNEIFCILGHNGAGKSTLVKIMTGLIQANKGTIYYDGRDFNTDHIKIRQEM